MPEPEFLFPELTPSAALGLARRSPRCGCGDLHRSEDGPHAADARESHVAAAARLRHRRKRGRNGWRAVEPGAPRLARGDFVEHGYDIKRLIQTIVTSRTYQMPSVARKGEARARLRVLGPEVRRMTAEQFADAIGTAYRRMERRAGQRAPPGAAGRGASGGGSAPSQPRQAGVYAREWRVASTSLTRALGRPIRDQIISTRASDATTLQALELTNGEILAQWLSRGARRMVGELPAEPVSLYNSAVAGRNASSSRVRNRHLEIEQALADRSGGRIQRSGSDPARVGAGGARRSVRCHAAFIAHADRRLWFPSRGQDRFSVTGASGDGVRVKNPSVVVYDIAGKRFSAVPRHHGTREQTERHRLDAQSVNEVLRLRHGPRTWNGSSRRSPGHRWPLQQRCPASRRPSIVSSGRRSVAHRRQPNAASPSPRSAIPRAASDRRLRDWPICCGRSS